MSNQAQDKIILRDLVEKWVIYRDAGLWDKFREVWHDDGRMIATWTQGTADEFIAMNKAGWEKGLSILHFLGAHVADINADRAVTQTKMTISQRALVSDVLVDVVCTGRFYDFWERREGDWGLCLRQPIYEKDRMDPVDPAMTLKLDADLLAQFPEGYRHLAYLQSGLGYPVEKDMPGLKGSKTAALYAAGDRWLAGQQITWKGGTWG